jgi:hypothetical protein
MSPRDCYLEIRRQIIDEGRRSWGLNDYGGNVKLFKDRCLTPLEQLSEVYGHLYMSYVYGGRKREQITSVHIVGEVDHLVVLKGI